METNENIVTADTCKVPDLVKMVIMVAGTYFVVKQVMKYKIVRKDRITKVK